MVVAKLRRISSPDTPSLEAFRPESEFGIAVYAFVGPANGPGEESFGITVCTPVWFEQSMTNKVMSGRHLLFIREYDYDDLKNFLEGYCRTSMGNSWREVAEKVGRLGYWEFEDYKPYEKPL
jgi:hypothetical protein